MFSLIIVLVSILLVGALALATVYYGGDTFVTAGTDAEVARLTNEASQVRLAAAAHHAQRQAYAPTVQALIDEQYLSTAPGGATWAVFEDTLVATDLSEAQCLAINKRLNVTGIPACSEPQAIGAELCCNPDS